MTTNKIEKQTYLRFPESVRKNCSMYLGGTSEPSVSFREVFDNAVDTITMGLGTTEVKAFVQDDYFLVTDNGPGLPLYTDTQVEGEEIPAAVGIFSRLHSGSKSGGTGMAHGGLHGIGVAATCATSSSLIAIVNLKKRIKNDGKNLHKTFNKKHEIVIIEFNEGILSRCESAKKEDAGIELPDNFGTVVIVKPDPKIWSSVKPEIDPMTLALNKSNLLSSGIDAYLEFNGQEVRPFSMNMAFPKTEMRDKFLYEFQGTIPHESLSSVNFTVQCSFALDAWDNAGVGSANGMPALTGPHVNSAINGVSRGLAEMSNTLNATDCKASLRVFVQISAANRLRFDGQSKSRLADIEDLSSKALSSSIAAAFTESLKGKPKVREWFETLLKYLVEYKKASGNVELTEHLKDEIKTSTQGTLGGEGSKFYEAAKQKDKNSELMIVEGDSALSNILKVRNKAHNAGLHALLPLRGKIINTAKAEPERSFDNKEVKTLFRVMGAGIEGVNFDLKALRYGKVIIMADSDPDGASIQALLIAMFCRYAPEIIRAGRLFILVTPLYGQEGKYIFDEADLNRDKKFSRYKGLGALEPEHILDTIFGTERKLVRLTEDNMKAAIELVAKPAPKKALMKDAGLIK